MALKGGDTMRRKIVVNNNFIGQTNKQTLSFTHVALFLTRKTNILLLKYKHFYRQQEFLREL